MHIPKLLAMISVATLGAGSLSVQAQRPDTDMQAIAREQMRQALEKLDAQHPGIATNAAPVAAKPKPKKVATPPPAQPTMVIVPAAPKPVAPPPVAVPPPAMQVQTAPAQMTTPPPVTAPPGTTAQPPVTAPLPVTAPPPVTASAAAASIPEQPKPVAVAKKKAPPIKATGFSPYSPIAESPGQNPPVTLVIPGENPVMAPGNALKRSDERKAREEVRKGLGETGPSGQMETKPEAKFPVEAKMGTDAKVTAHPTLVPGSKEDRLSELLDLYKADKISPAEYHEQRAKILAEP